LSRNLQRRKKPVNCVFTDFLLVGVTGLELKDLIIANYRTFRKSPILRTLRWCNFCSLMQKIISFRKNNGQIKANTPLSLHVSTSFPHFFHLRINPLVNNWSTFKIQQVSGIVSVISLT
jgi:hypothetical protein